MKINKTLINTTVGHFLNDGLTFLPAYLVVFLEKAYGYSYLDVALMVAAYQLSNAFFSPFIGKYIDGVMKKGALLTMGVAGLAGAYLLFSINYPDAIALYVFIASMIVIGAFSTLYHPIASMILNSKYKEKAGTALGIAGIGGSLGRAIAPGLFLMLVTLSGTYRDAIALLSGSFIIISFFIFINFKKDTYFVPRQMGKKVVVYTLPLLMLFIVAVLRGMAINGGVMMIPTYLHKTLTYSPSLIGLIIVISFTGPIFGQPILGKLSDKYGRKLMLTTTTAIYGISMLIFVFETNIYAVTTTLGIIYFVGLSGFPLLMSLVGNIAESSSLGEASAIIFGLGGGMGAAFGTFLIGFISHTASSFTAFTLVGIFAIISATLVTLIQHKPKKS